MKKKKKIEKRVKVIIELTYDWRLLSAAEASSGEAISTNAKPLFLLLVYIESLNPKQKNIVR